MAHEIELREEAIADSFKNTLKTTRFVTEAEYEGIEQRLNILVEGGQVRYKQVQASKWIWGFFLKKCLRNITDKLRGCTELCRYFDM